MRLEFTIHEVVPGLAFINGTVCVCPGCGLEEAGQQPYDEVAVLVWCRAVFELHSKHLPPQVLEKGPEALAREYMEKRWHEVA